MTQFKQTVDDLIPFVKQVTEKTEDKALRDIARAIAIALFESDMDLKTYLRAYKDDKIFDPSCLFTNVNSLSDYVVKKFKLFCNVLFQLRPVGLGTPNAACGEGELMALFSSPRVGISKVKNTGDITVDGKSIELKAHEFRLFGNCTGIELQDHADSIAKKYKVTANKCNGNRTAFEPWDNSPKKEQHWVAEFKRLGVKQSKEYLYELMSRSGDFSKSDIADCFIDDHFVVERFRKVIIKTFFKNMDKKWNYFTQITESKVRCINTDVNQFNALVDADEIVVSANYFRSFQDIKVGLYCQLS